MSFSKFAPGKAVMEMLGKQSETILAAAQILAQMATAEPSERKALYKELHKVENAADALTNDVLHKVAQSFVLHYDREDIYALTNQIDDVVDLIDDTGDAMLLYRVGVLPQKALNMVDIINQCAQLTVNAIKHIDKIDDSTQEYWRTIEKLEHQGDKTQRSVMRDIFADETGPVLEIMKSKFVVDELEKTINGFETLSKVVKGIAIKES